MIDYRRVVLCVALILVGCAPATPEPPTLTPRPTITPTPPPATVTPTATPEQRTLLEVADEMGTFSALLLAADAAGVTEVLEEEGPYTIFAPTDAAFSATLQELGMTPLELMANVDLLESIVRYHIIGTRIEGSEIAVLPALPTLNGEDIRVSDQTGITILNGEVIVSEKDIPAVNGVIHVIDRVLIPPSVVVAMGLDLPFRPTVLYSYDTEGEVGAGAAEIVAFDVETNTLILLRGDLDAVELLDATDPANLNSKGIVELGGSPNSVAVMNGLIAVAVEGEETNDPGAVVIIDAEGEEQYRFETGVMPDMVTFSPDGDKIITANEGEPNDGYFIDPVGSVTVIDISAGVEDGFVTTLGFEAFNRGAARGNELSPLVRMYGRNANFARDAEPEYVAVSPDSSTAYVTLQENNAIAIIDLVELTIVRIIPLGVKDHALEANALDAVDDGDIEIETWPVYGMYLPDAIQAFTHEEVVYLITANEGDSRDYAGFSEETTIGEVRLDPNKFSENALRPIFDLEITRAQGDTDRDGDFDSLFTFGTRSFTIWTTEGQIVFDSGDWLERIAANVAPEKFNSNGTPDDMDSRSSAKGPEPEAVTLGEIDGRLYAFVGLERFGGVMVFEITIPTAPEYITYIDHEGDISPEGVLFIKATDSPTGNALLVVAHEVSGTMTVYDLRPQH